MSRPAVTVPSCREAAQRHQLVPAVADEVEVE
jgi:hypothetical protein